MKNLVVSDNQLVVKIDFVFYSTNFNKDKQKKSTPFSGVNFFVEIIRVAHL